MNKFVTAIVSIAKVLVRPVFPVKFYGPKKLERKKSLLVGNHVSGWDPVVYTLHSKTWVSFIYKSEFRKSAFLRWIFDGLDLIPFHRGEVDLRDTKCVLNLLEDGHVVGLFPEGTRNPGVDEMQPFRTGAAMFALKTHAPIRAFYTWDKAKAFHRNYIMVGEEFTLEQFYDRPINKELLIEATAYIREEVEKVRHKLNAMMEEKGKKRRKFTKKEQKKLARHLARQEKIAQLQREAEEIHTQAAVTETDVK